MCRNRSSWKNWGVLFAFSMSILAMGCAQEIGDIDKTQSERIEKEQFAGVWYYVKTVTDIPYSSAFSFQGEMNFGDSAKIVFDVQEEYLIAYPIVETVLDMENDYQKLSLRRYWEKDNRDQFVEVYVGQPVGAWNIKSHFDLKREYNAATGEQSNVLSENTTDRPWWERDYIRVDWNSESIREGYFISGRVDAETLNIVQESEQNPLNPEAPEFEDDYISIVNKYIAWPNPYACSVYVLGRGDCAAAPVTVRHSFKRAPSSDDVEVRFYENRLHQDKFGYFLAERYDYDSKYGTTDAGQESKAQQWKLWDVSQDFEPLLDGEGNSTYCSTNVDCPKGSRCMAEEWFDANGQCMVGTPRPYRTRGLNPIIYHMSAGFPGLSAPVPVVGDAGNLLYNADGKVEYYGGSVVLNSTTNRAHPFVIEAYETADNWSVLFKDTVSWLFFHEDIGTLHVSEKAEGARACEQHMDCLAGSPNVVAWGYVDSTDKVDVGCATGNDCGADEICYAGGANGAEVCAQQISCLAEVFGEIVSQPCPLGSTCNGQNLCEEADGTPVMDIANVKNKQAFTYVVFDSDEPYMDASTGDMDYVYPKYSDWNPDDYGVFACENSTPDNNPDHANCLTGNFKKPCTPGAPVPTQTQWLGLENGIGVNVDTSCLPGMFCDYHPDDVNQYFHYCFVLPAGAQMPSAPLNIQLVRLLDNIFPFNISKGQRDANGLVRFVNTTDSPVTLRMVVSDPETNSADTALITENIFENVSAVSETWEDQEASLGTVPAEYSDDRFPYEIVESQKLRRLEVVDAAENIVASISNLKISASRSYVFVYAGEGNLVSASELTDGGSGVRAIHAAPEAGTLDFGVDSLLMERSVTVGSVVEYHEPLVEGVNRFVVLKGGTPGDVTCFNDEGVGKCVGWGPVLDDNTDVTVAAIKDGIPEMFVLCEAIYTGDDCAPDDIGSMAAMNDCRYSTLNEDGSISNPCKDRVAHPNSLKKIGDARYNQFFWVGQPHQSSPLGYGPSAIDPETGRAFHAVANIYGGPMETYGTYAADLLDLINGNLDLEDVISGDYVADYIAAKKIISPDPADLETLPHALTLGTSLSGNAGNTLPQLQVDSPLIQALIDRLPPAHEVQDKMEFVNNYLLDPSFRPKMIPEHHPLSQPASRQFRLELLKGSWIEDMLMTDEVKVAMSSGTLTPEMDISEDWRKELSLSTFGGPAFLKSYSQRQHLLASNNVYMGEFIDDSLVGMALELGCTAEAFADGDTEVTDYVIAVDLIETRKETTGVEELPSEYCLSGDAFRMIVMARMFGGVLEHEVGHTVGLRHNFSASGDIFNYFDAWYDIREREAVHCIDNGGCNVAQQEICVFQCLSDDECPSFAKCEAYGNTEFKACFDKRDEYNDVVGTCMGHASIAVEEADCAFAANEVPVPSNVNIFIDGECLERRYCGDDVHCDQAQYCHDQGFCADENGILSTPAYVSGCEVDDDCGKGFRCATASLGDPGEDLVCVGVVPKIAPRAKMTAQEAVDKRTEYQYSSVMDYGQKINADVHGLGKYDRAAILFGYGDLVEVYKDTSHIDGYVEGLADAYSNSIGQVSIWGRPSFWMNSIYHPFKFLNDVVGPENVKNTNRSVMPYQQVGLDQEMQYDYLGRDSNNSYKEVYYDYCSDEFRGNLGCYYFDTGADDIEIVDHAMGMLRSYYIFDAFKRDRLSFGWGNAQRSYYARILDRWMRPMRNSGVYNGLYQMIFSGYGDFWRQFTKEPMSGYQWRGSAELAVQFLTDLIASPAPGSYQYDAETNTYVNVSYESGQADFDVPIGMGKFPYTTYDPQFGYYQWNHPLFVGSYWEKLAALTTLTDSDITFLSDYVGEALSIGTSSSIGFNTMYPRQMNNLFGGIITGDATQWWGIVEEDSNGDLVYRPRSLFDASDEVEGKTRVRPSLDNLNMKVMAAIYAMTSLPAGFDPSVTDSLAVVIKGNHSEYALGAGVEWVEFSDPFSGKTFMALKPNYDEQRIATAYTLVERGNELVEDFLDISASPEDLANTQAEIEELVFVLQMLRSLNEQLGTINL